MILFNEIHFYLRMSKPNIVTLEDIETTCNNYSGLCPLMDSIFSTLNSKRGDMKEEKIETLKCDLNLARIKWYEIILGYAPKFHMLYEHVHDISLDLNCFYEMGEDSIEKWHQIRMRHHARIRSL